MATDPKDEGGITNAVLLEHMQGMKHELKQDMKAMRDELKNDILVLQQDMIEVKTHLGKIDVALQRLYTHRVDHTERIERLEKAVFQ